MSQDVEVSDEESEAAEAVMAWIDSMVGYLIYPLDKE